MRTYKKKKNFIVHENYIIMRCKHKNIVYMRHCRRPGIIRVNLKPGYYENRYQQLEKMAHIARKALASVQY
jgi:hypothetical protein